jgi:glycosyltransferase involved in cell wall biosynthesis
MIIGIEAERANTSQKTGVEHYAKQLILHLAKLDSVNTYILYLRTEPEEWFLHLPKNFVVKVMPFPIFWTQIRLSLEMLLHPPDVLFVPASALPLVHPKNSVITIHDVAWRYFPESFTWFMKWFLEWSTQLAVKRAGKIIAVSESTKQDILKFYKVDAGKIEVVYHGYQAEIFNFQLSIFNQNIKLPPKYVLFLSTLQPRKNLAGLIEAFRLLKNDHPDLPHKLVVVGKAGWKYESIIQKIKANKDLVVYLNYLPDEERLGVLAKADLLALPSFYEGFGMQILEAFALHVPVVLSNASSLPEVAGEAGLYFDPKKPMDIKQAIASVLFDKSLAEKLTAKGRERLKLFSWEKCAKETLDIFLSFRPPAAD